MLKKMQQVIMQLYLDSKKLIKIYFLMAKTLLNKEKVIWCHLAMFYTNFTLKIKSLRQRNKFFPTRPILKDLT